MKMILKNTTLELQKALVETSTLNNACMYDTSNPGKVVSYSGYHLFIYKNISGGDLKFTLTGKANTWGTPGCLYGIFDDEPELGDVATSYKMVNQSESYSKEVVVPNGKYIGISEYAYAPASGGSCVVTYEQV